MYVYDYKAPLKNTRGKLCTHKLFRYENILRSQHAPYARFILISDITIFNHGQDKTGSQQNWVDSNVLKNVRCNGVRIMKLI